MLIFSTLVGVVWGISNLAAAEATEQKSALVPTKQPIPSGENQALPCTTGLRDAINAAIAEIQSASSVVSLSARVRTSS